MKSLFRLNRSLLLLPVCAAAVVTVAGCSMETELLMPEGITSVLDNPAYAQDELGMSIIEGLSGNIGEAMANLPDGKRLRLSFEIKKQEI